MLSEKQYPQKLQQALAPVTAVSTPPHQGMTSFVTFAETALGSVAIKHAAGQRLPALRREKIILDALVASTLPVTECLLFLEVENEQEAEGWLVMRRLPGEPLQQVYLAADQPSQRACLLSQFGKIVAQIHALPIPPELAAESTPWLESMLDQAKMYLPLGLWQGNPAHLEELKQQRPTPVTPAFIHGDLFLDNVLTDGIEITGIIDWSFAAAGDPRYDLAVAMDELLPPDKQAFLDGYGLPSGISTFEAEYFLKLAAFC
jgi:aminoglycoside phosphotransferase (APT) family kinase protein